jgi:hypothetical protein
MLCLAAAPSLCGAAIKTLMPFKLTGASAAQAQRSHFFCISGGPCSRGLPGCVYWLGCYAGGKFDLDAAAGPTLLDLGDLMYAPILLTAPAQVGQRPQPVSTTLQNLCNGCSNYWLQQVAYGPGRMASASNRATALADMQLDCSQISGGGFLLEGEYATSAHTIVQRCATIDSMCFCCCAGRRQPAAAVGLVE